MLKATLSEVWLAFNSFFSFLIGPTLVLPSLSLSLSLYRPRSVRQERKCESVLTGNRRLRPKKKKQISWFRWGHEKNNNKTEKVRNERPNECQLPKHKTNIERTKQKKVNVKNRERERERERETQHGRAASRGPVVAWAPMSFIRF